MSRVECLGFQLNRVLYKGRAPEDGIGTTSRGILLYSIHALGFWSVIFITYYSELASGAHEYLVIFSRVADLTNQGPDRSRPPEIIQTVRLAANPRICWYSL